MLEPNRSPYAPIIDRPVVRWPGNARVALWVAPNIEFKDFIPEPNYGQTASTAPPTTAPPSPTS